MEPKLRGAVVALGVAIAALSTAFGAAGMVRHAALRHSHELPIDESWFEHTAAPSPEEVQHGRKLFLNNCAHCHGVDATGDEGPDLHGVQVSDRYIRHLVLKGMPHEMPSFARKLKADDVTALIAYVRSLDSSAGDAP